MDEQVRIMNGQKSQKVFWALGLCGMAAIFSSTLSKIPVLPLYALHLGANEAQVGWIAAASTVPGIFLSFYAGVVSDRYGWKRLLMLALLVFATAPPLYLVVNDSLQLAVVRFYHGIATAILGPVAMAAIVSNSSHRKGELLSLYSSLTMIGRATAPFVGGFILTFWGFHGVFLICALSGFAALVVGVSIKLKIENLTVPKNSQNLKENKKLSNLREIFFHRPLVMVGMLETVVFFSFGAFEVIFPIYAKGLGITVGLIGVIMGLQLAGIIIFKPVFGRLSDRIGRMPIILAGLMLCSLAVGGLFFCKNILFIGIMNVGFGLGFALVTSSTRPLAADIARKGEVGASLGIISTLMDLGQVAGPPVVGMVAAFYGYQAGFLLMAAILAGTATIYVFILARLKLNSPSL
ncbi:MFS transporter [Desulforamulus aquiferis]|uniref:MFS transporter n=1 Tax=Desulforamulus aquiferis TaxID=1397668 RepID=A0AAW7ZDN9_9FIRM|nr:MFS transporter [Desulforamulus aquiferis]MDO7787610.1 MFS transporter [Desulforamulus aquiferis]